MSDLRKNTMTYRPDIARPPADLTPVAPKPQAEMPQQLEEEGSKLIVGRNIQLKGEITACDTLVVEGRVEASMNSRIIDIAESGLFSGTAEVERAGIHGRFEGELTVNGRLSVYSTGRVSGTIRYGEIVIEAGGEIAGDVQLVARTRPAAVEKPERTMPGREAPSTVQKSLQWPPNGKAAGAPASAAKS